MWPRYSRCDWNPPQGLSFAQGVLPGVDLCLDSAGENIAVAIETARGPDSLMIPIPPWPPGVAIAAIVELSILLRSQLLSLLAIFLGENYQFSHKAFPPAFRANIRIIL